MEDFDLRTSSSSVASLQTARQTLSIQRLFCTRSGVARRVVGLATQICPALKNHCSSRFAAKVVQNKILIHCG